MTASLEERVRRPRRAAQIRGLAIRYAAAMERQDSLALSELYVDDVRVAGGGTGRQALRDAYFGEALTRLSLSVLHMGTHVIDLDLERPDRARGSVYTTAQIRDGDRSIRQAICYFDRYAERDGRWLFISRDHQLFYGVDVGERPNHLPPANWPASDTGTGTLPFGWPTWQPR